MPMPTPSTHYMEKEYDTFAMATGDNCVVQS